MSAPHIRFAYVPESLTVPCPRCGVPIEHDVVAIGYRAPTSSTYIWAHWTCVNDDEKRSTVAVAAVSGFLELEDVHQREVLDDVDVARFESPHARAPGPGSCALGTASRNGPFTPLSGDLLEAYYRPIDAVTFLTRTSRFCYMAMEGAYDVEGATTVSDVQQEFDPALRSGSERSRAVSSQELAEHCCTRADISVIRSQENSRTPVTPCRSWRSDSTTYGPWRFSKPVTSPNNPFVTHTLPAAARTDSPAPPQTAESPVHKIASQSHSCVIALSAEDSRVLALCQDKEKATLTPGQGPLLVSGGILHPAKDRDCPAITCALVSTALCGKTLCLVPKHMIQTWKACFAKHPALRVYANAKRIPAAQEMRETDVVLTTLAAARSCEHVSWDRIIFDKGDFLLDRNSPQNELVQRLKGMIRWILPARPIELTNEMLYSACAALHVFPPSSRHGQSSAQFLKAHASRIASQILI